jgi:hypothetical protein
MGGRSMNWSIDLGMITTRGCRLQPDIALNCQVQLDTVPNPVTPNPDAPMLLKDYQQKQRVT